MKNRKSATIVRILSAVGLLMITVPQLLKRYVALPDFVNRVMAGIGIGLIITGLIMQKRQHKACCEQAGDTGSI